MVRCGAEGETFSWNLFIYFLFFFFCCCCFFFFPEKWTFFVLRQIFLRVDMFFDCADWITFSKTKINFLRSNNFHKIRTSERSLKLKFAIISSSFNEIKEKLICSKHIHFGFYDALVPFVRNDFLRFYLPAQMKSSACDRPGWKAPRSNWKSMHCF